MLPLPDLDQLDVAAKDALIRAPWDKVQSLTTQVQTLLTRVAELEARSAKDSRNSSKPPSSDGLRKPKSLRKAGQNPPGGQQGHTGNTLKRVMQPDRTVTHPLPPTCDACGSILPTGEIATETRQVFDLPPVRVEVTEHRILEARCTCGKAHRGSFPADVAATAQYGSNIKALVVYLTQHLLLLTEN
jgi:transposase